MNREQLNINFVPLENESHFIRYVESKLGNLTKGHGLLEWIEQIGNYMYVKTGQNKQEVNLKDYFGILKIGGCRFKKDLTVNAQLLVENAAFIIELKDYGQNNDFRRQRFHLAHELAHVIFFDIRRVPIRSYDIFPPGSREIEYLCNRIARAILIPECVLSRKSERYAKPGDPEFHLGIINKFCQDFRVPANALLHRLVRDTGAWNCLVLRFIRFKDEDSVWRLKERYLPPKYWQNIKAFIPLEDLKKERTNPKRYPSAKGNLARHFESVCRFFNDEKENPEKMRRVTRQYPLSEIRGNPIDSFLNVYFTNDDLVTIHYSLGLDKFTKTWYLNVCIPLH
ncbi:MAG: ImmA/IrrE family metallo-endopeptidase [Sediminibacterium sp.]